MHHLMIGLISENKLPDTTIKWNMEFKQTTKHFIQDGQLWMQLHYIRLLSGDNPTTCWQTNMIYTDLVVLTHHNIIRVKQVCWVFVTDIIFWVKWLLYSDFQGQSHNTIKYSHEKAGV